MPKPTLWSIVLAAGGSSRLGRPKQLLRQQASPLLWHAVRRAERISPGRVLVVVGAQGLRLRSMLRRSQLRALVVTNSAWQSGISSSLERSLTALPADADAALITLADQALISTPDLKRLETKWRCNPGRCAAAEYAGQLGVPAIIPRKYWGAIRLLDGDIGARRVLRSFPRIVAVALPNAAFDVDTAADANELGLT